MTEAADDTAEPATSTVAQDRAREGIDHLQNAARELIAAARAALDVAEDLIDDPDTMASVVGAAGQLGGLGDLVRNLLPTARSRREAEPFAAADEPAVQRIEVV